MAVVIETTLGDITVDLFIELRPQSCLNFIKLCKLKYYNYNLFHTIQSGFIAQTGDPTGEGTGGESIWAKLHGKEKRYFSCETMPKIRHTRAGLLSMVCVGDGMIGSQFFFTLAPDLDSLDGVHCVIGEVVEGFDILRKLNEVICDEGHRPYQDVRITHTVILEDPFNNPPKFREPSRSPSPTMERLAGGRIAPDEELDEYKGKSVEEIQDLIEDREAKARATILEIVGDLPDAEMAPPENVLFVCKLNSVTTDEDLEIIFSRFGKIVNCEVIRDKKSGDSLQYAFIEFSDKKSCEDAYFKMDNVLIDDRRIHVDFSQSVSKIKWLGKGRGVIHINDNDNKKKIKEEISSKTKDRHRSNSRDRNIRRSRSRGRNNQRSHSRERDTRDRNYHTPQSKDKSNYIGQRRDKINQRSDSRDKNMRRSRSRERNNREKNNSKSKNRDQNNRRSRSRERNNRSHSRERYSRKSPSRDRKKGRSQSKDRNKYRDRVHKDKRRSRSRSAHREKYKSTKKSYDDRSYRDSRRKSSDRDKQKNDKHR